MANNKGGLKRGRSLLDEDRVFRHFRGGKPPDAAGILSRVGKKRLFQSFRDIEASA